MAMGEGGVGDGGPAFPGEKAMRFGQTNDCNEGMTLRDYFAAKAMQGITSHPDTWGRLVPEIAAVSYEIADALLAARGRS